MCTVLLPPGDNPIAVNKYISISYHNCAMELVVKSHSKEVKNGCIMLIRNFE